MSKYIILAIVLVLILLYFVHTHIESFTVDLSTETYIIGNGTKKLLIITGVHGNETAGSRMDWKSLLSQSTTQTPKYDTQFALNDMGRSGLVTKTLISPSWHSVTVLDLNKGLARSTREMYGEDFNRLWDVAGVAGSNNSNINPQVAAIRKYTKNLINQHDFVVDFHEGWGFHSHTSSSIGSTLTASRHSTRTLPESWMSLTKSELDMVSKYPWVIRHNNCDIPSSLGCYCDRLGKPYLLIETTGQNEIQDFSVREQQIKIVVNRIIKS